MAAKTLFVHLHRRAGWKQSSSCCCLSFWRNSPKTHSLTKGCLDNDGLLPETSLHVCRPKRFNSIRVCWPTPKPYYTSANIGCAIPSARSRHNVSTAPCRVRRLVKPAVGWKYLMLNDKRLQIHQTIKIYQNQTVLFDPFWPTPQQTRACRLVEQVLFVATHVPSHACSISGSSLLKSTERRAEPRSADDGLQRFGRLGGAVSVSSWSVFKRKVK